MPNQIATESKKPIQQPRNAVRRQTSLTSISEVLIEQLAFFFPEKDVELYRQWQIGVPIKGLSSMFNLKSDEVKRVVRQIDQRLETCFEPHRVKALLELIPICRYPEDRATDYLTQVDEALVKLATIRVDRINKDKLKLIHDQTATVLQECGQVEKYLSQQTPAYERSVRELKFSARTANILAVAHITTIGQLCKLTVRDLHSMRGAGTTVINEVQMGLSNIGLSMKPSAKR